MPRYTTQGITDVLLSYIATDTFYKNIISHHSTTDFAFRAFYT